MADPALDPEPSDKRTKEWKEWSARHGGGESRLAVLPDPNLFAAHFFAALASFGWNGDRLQEAKNRWHDARRLIEWVNSGQDEIDFRATLSAEEKLVADKLALEKADKEAAEASRRAAQEAFGKRRAAALSS